jgi:hypothetical protein
MITPQERQEIVDTVTADILQRLQVRAQAPVTATFSRGILNIGFEEPATVESPVFSEKEVGLEVDVLVDLRLYNGQLQGQFKTLIVSEEKLKEFPDNDDPEWDDLIETTPSETTACP